MVRPIQVSSAVALGSGVWLSRLQEISVPKDHRFLRRVVTHHVWRQVDLIEGLFP